MMVYGDNGYDVDNDNDDEDNDMVMMMVMMKMKITVMMMLGYCGQIQRDNPLHCPHPYTKLQTLMKYGEAPVKRYG